MTDIEFQPKQSIEQIALKSLISHRQAVGADNKLGEAYEVLQKLGYHSCAVLDKGKLIGLCSKNSLGTLLGHRYGHAIFSKRKVREHLDPNPTIVRDGENVREALNKVLLRQGQAFNEDVILVGKAGDYIGIITVPTLMKLQSDLVLEKLATQEVLNNELLSVSRQAGMAEVATSVLHNVGNVLNSVKVSAGIIDQKMRGSKISAVSKVSQLLELNKERLGEFITTDDRGRKLPAYLQQLGKHLENEQAAIRAELRGLTEYIEHIEQIISTQQSYARVGSVCQSTTLSSVIEDAIKISGIKEKGIQLETNIDENGPVVIDKHKILQILINLLSNAKHACVARKDQDGVVKVVARTNGEKTTMEVIDNGIGISKENLKKIFTHGFTTRKEGHGFGLHNSALTAQELGGSLSVESAGPNQGATFRLELATNPQLHNRFSKNQAAAATATSSHSTTSTLASYA